MKPGQHPTAKTPISTIWINEENILHSVINPDYDPDDFEANKTTFDAMEDMAKGEKVKLIVETGKLKSGSREIRDYADERMKNFLSAAAYITPNAFSKMVMNVFIANSKGPYPVRFFSNYKDAYQWIQQI